MQIQSRALCVKCLVDGELPRERKGYSLRYKPRIPLSNNEEAIPLYYHSNPNELGAICVMFYDNEGVFLKDPAEEKGGLFSCNKNYLIPIVLSLWHF